jgi:tRNA (guanine-N7-)-methyltransferase
VVHLLRLLAGGRGADRFRRFGADGGGGRVLIRPVEAATVAGVAPLARVGAGDLLEGLLAPGGPWEVELGFGKGRYLLRRAAADPGLRFLGVEVAREYFELAAGRLARRGLPNVALLHGEALYLLSAVLPRGFARAVHVYFPDPWPKTRHARRRLFSPATVDLVLGLLAPGARLAFATDFLDYGEEVAAILAAIPGSRVIRLAGGWPEGPRTNYEAKYQAEGRPIVRLEVELDRPVPLHPAASAQVLAAVGPPG